AAAKAPITNLRQRTVTFDNEIARQFLLLVDGTRTIDQLVTDLAASLEATGTAQPDKSITRPDVEHHLKALAKLALLVRERSSRKALPCQSRPTLIYLLDFACRFFSLFPAGRGRGEGRAPRRLNRH